MTLVFHSAHLKCSDLEQSNGSGQNTAKTLPKAEALGVESNALSNYLGRLGCYTHPIPGA
jgi:hypothetical protein